jgi:DNA polymerase-3 subunit alpha
LTDFLERIRDRSLNKKSLEAFVMSGALDAFEERGRMLANTDIMLTFNREASASANSAQNSLFDSFGGGPKARLDLADTAPATQSDKLRWEKELLGLYISGHPLDRLRETFEKRETDIRRVKQELKEGMMAVVAGLVETSKQIITKSGDKMLFATLTDLSDAIEVVVFPKLFAECREHLEAEKCVAVKGRISHRNGGISMVAEAVKAI